MTQNEVVPSDEADHQLKQLAIMIEQTNADVYLTIHTHGMLISGLVVAAPRFWKALMTFSDRELSDYRPSGLDSNYQLFHDRASAAQEEKQGNPGPLDEYTLLHFQHANFIIPGQTGSLTKPYPWRVRISEISGFTYGQILEL